MQIYEYVQLCISSLPSILGIGYVNCGYNKIHCVVCIIAELFVSQPFVSQVG